MSMSRRSWTLLAVALATFMTYLDNNIVNVAIPSIQRSLHLSSAGLEWVVSGYVLVFAGLLLVGGRLADAYGRRRLFLIGLGIFTASSLLAGLSESASVLIVARALQGFGAAMVTPTTLAIINNEYTEGRERAAAIGIWSAVGALALALGPLLGGVLTEYVSWHWIFTVNVPVGLAVLALGAWAIRESKTEERHALDLPGLIASVVSLTAITWALIEGNQRGWTSVPVLTALAVGIAGGVTFALLERQGRDPMVDLSLFANRVFSGGLVALMLWAFGLFGIYFFTSLYLQNVLGFSPVRAGLAFLPMAIFMIIGAIASEQLGHRVGEHRLVGFAMGLMGLGIASVALLGANAHFLDLMPSFVAIGIGGGLTTPLTAMVMGVMPTEQSGVASGVFNASRELAGLLGITVIGVILTARENHQLHAGHSVTTAFLSGYRLGLLAAAALVSLGAIAAFFALRQARTVTLPGGPTDPMVPAVEAFDLVG